MLSVLSNPNVSRYIANFNSFEKIIKKNYKYGDIDLFYLNENKNKSQVGEILKSQGYSSLYTSKFSKTYTKYESRVVNSLNTYTKKVIQQIVMKFDTIDDIFSSFDIANCKVAYHKGYLYFTDDFLESWKKLEIVY